MLAFATGCSAGAAHPTTTPDTTSTTSAADAAASLANRFIVAASATDSAVSQARAGVAGATTVAGLINPCHLYEAALVAFDRVVLLLGATGQVATDIQALVGDNETTVNDLNQVNRQTTASLPSLASTVAADGTRAAQATSAVEADLGIQDG